MLPPIDEAVLQNNPDFALLYQKLTTVILNPDGSTREDPSAKKRKQVRDELDKHRLKAAKEGLLTRAIATATPPEKKAAAQTIPNRKGVAPRAQATRQQALSEPLLDLLLILPPLLETPLDEESTKLILSSPPLSQLEELLPDLAEVVAAGLHTSALGLARVANPTTNPSYLHRSIPSLPTALSNLETAHAEAQQSLAAARLKTLSSLIKLQGIYNSVLTHLIRLLESKHTVLSRSSLLQAQTVSLESQQTELQIQAALHGLKKEIYTPASVEALQNYAGHLKDARTRLEERIQGLEAELQGYGVGVEGGENKEKMMREMARVYGEMQRKMEDTEGDLHRLRRR